MEPPPLPSPTSGFYHDDMSRPGLDEHQYMTDGGCAIRMEFTVALVSAVTMQRILDLIEVEMRAASPVVERVLSLMG